MLSGCERPGTDGGSLRHCGFENTDCTCAVKYAAASAKTIGGRGGCYGQLEQCRMARFRVIILHGAHGGPDTNWFPWLHATLEAEGIEVVRPRFPTPVGQSLSAWLDAYDLAVKSLPLAPTVLVGHSLVSPVRTYRTD